MGEGFADFFLLEARAGRSRQRGSTVLILNKKQNKKIYLYVHDNQFPVLALSS